MDVRHGRIPPRVIAGLSFSVNSIYALAVARDLAIDRALDLVVITAWTPFGGQAGARSFPSPELDGKREESFRQKQDEICSNVLGNRPLRVIRRTVQGAPHAALLEAVHHEGDMLVLGARRRVLLRRPGPLSVAGHCLRRSACPVLVAPPSPLLGMRIPPGVRLVSF